MKVAAYQAPLLPCGSMDAIELIHERVVWCETQGVEILCCPEAVVGGLADYADRPRDYALNVKSGQLDAMMKPLASEVITTIVGFTEIDETGQLYNSAAILNHGSIAGVYRKQHPAIRKSVYQAGHSSLVLAVGEIKIGVIICNDSNFPETAAKVAEQGATVLFIPTNNALTVEKADIVQVARNIDVTRARKNHLWVVRADVVGRLGNRVSYGSSGIVSPDGSLVEAARELSEDTLVVDIGR